MNKGGEHDRVDLQEQSERKWREDRHRVVHVLGPLSYPLQRDCRHHVRRPSGQEGPDSLDLAGQGSFDG